MGLDQFAYVASTSNTSFDDSSRQEIAYWRKHPNIQGWMEQLWLRKMDIPVNSSDQYIQNKYPSDSFNGVELELTWDDIDKLEKDIISEKVSKLNTTGFFFGKPSDDYYREYDLQFCRNAKAELFIGRRVFYNSSW